VREERWGRDGSDDGDGKAHAMVYIGGRSRACMPRSTPEGAEGATREGREGDGSRAAGEGDKRGAPSLCQGLNSRVKRLRERPGERIRVGFFILKKVEIFCFYPFIFFNHYILVSIIFSFSHFNP
jgi:hypothetical protein